MDNIITTFAILTLLICTVYIVQNETEYHHSINHINIRYYQPLTDYYDYYYQPLTSYYDYYYQPLTSYYDYYYQPLTSYISPIYDYYPTEIISDLVYDYY
jgi:hypothetical protein